MSDQNKLDRIFQLEDAVISLVEQIHSYTVVQANNEQERECLGTLYLNLYTLERAIARLCGVLENTNDFGPRGRK